MRRSEIIKSAALLLVVAVAPWVASAAEPSQPNFLFVIADDCTYRDIGCYGGQAHTPNIDRLATQGMRFTRCFQAAPMCSPTRHNIYTGLYPVHSGAYPNHAFARPGTKSVVHYLKPLGYRVALSGKRHISPQEVFPFENIPAAGNNPNIPLIDEFMVECKQAETPFCLFACSNEPHSPWNKGDASRYPADKIELPPYFVDTPQTRSNMSNYLAEITYFDGQVGNCLALLEKHKLADNTLVVVVSEQGSGFPFAKWTCYDSGLQSAFVARWPGRIEPDVVSDAMIEYVDLLPTYIDLAGGSVPEALDGKSLAPVLLGETDQHKKYVYGEMTTVGIINASKHFGIRSIRSEQFKYIWNFTPEVEFQNACTKSPIFQSWIAAAEDDEDAADKVRRYQQRPGEELYDITVDPLEWNNLADDPDHADIKAELRAQLLRWMEANGDRGQQTELEAAEHQTRALKKPGRKQRR